MSKVIKVLLAILLLGGLVVGYSLELPSFLNTFRASNLFFRSLFVGIVLSVLVYQPLKRQGSDFTEKLQIFLVVAVLFMAFCGWFGLFSNRFFASKEVSILKGSFIKETGTLRSRTGLLVRQKLEPDFFITSFLDSNNEIVQIRANRVLFPNTSAGQEIEIPTHRGLWGFNFFEP
jgi:hypothetical protein